MMRSKPEPYHAALPPCRPWSAPSSVVMATLVYWGWRCLPSSPVGGQATRCSHLSSLDSQPPQPSPGWHHGSLQLAGHGPIGCLALSEFIKHHGSSRGSSHPRSYRSAGMIHRAMRYRADRTVLIKRYRADWTVFMIDGPDPIGPCRDQSN